MGDQKHILSILKINGLQADATDDQIRSVLASARFTEEETTAALTMIRENKDTRTTVDGLHKVFRSDQVLKPAEISRLLGIDISVNESITPRHSNLRNPNVSVFQVFLLMIVSISIAVLCLLFYMYTTHIGIFHPSTDVAFNNE